MPDPAAGVDQSEYMTWNRWHSMIRPQAWLLVGMLLAGATAWGITMEDHSGPSAPERYRDALNRHDIDSALSLLAEDFKLRFTGTEFVITKKMLPDILGWDAGVNGHVEWTPVKGDEGWHAYEERESNEFFAMLGVPELRFRTSFRLDEAGKIAEQRYRKSPDQPSWEKELKVAVEWAREHHPDELEAIYPDGSLLYSEEGGRRWVALLREWKKATSD